jgi:hypothetical protein
MGGKGGGSSESTVRWAPYVEAAHIELIENYQNYRTWALVPDPVKGLYNWDYSGGLISSPYRDFTPLAIEDAFFGAGLDISSLVPVFDMYDQLITLMDLNASFNTIFADTVNGTVIDNLVSAQATKLSDDLEQVAYPRFECGLRDINSVISTSFMMGRAVMEQGRTKALAAYDAELRYRLYPIVIERWKATIDWNRMSYEEYVNTLKFYVMIKEELDKFTQETRAKNSLWVFTILEYERGCAAALAGPQTATNEVKGASTGQQIAGGVMMGLSALMMVGM